MHIAFYTHCTPLFHDMNAAWKRHLESRGHAVSVIETEWQWEQPFHVDNKADIHLFIACSLTLKALAKHGFPKTGKNVLWLFEPLSESDSASVHKKKVLLLREVISGFDGTIAMDSNIASHIQKIAPGMLSEVIPYTIDENRIQEPLADDKRKGDVIHIGSFSPRRKKVADLFKDKAMRTRFIWGNLWDRQRNISLSLARIALHIHIDEHAYFNQHRILEAWAAGCPVVSETFELQNESGLEDCRHLQRAEFGGLADACEELLSNRRKRIIMIQQSQNLLRDRYTPACRIPALINFFDALQQQG